eukprot:366387-Chlamydomonas_euryale.AAC.28
MIACMHARLRVPVCAARWQVIASAIGNEPPPSAVVKALEAAGVLPVQMLDKSMAWKCEQVRSGPASSEDT